VRNEKGEREVISREDAQDRYGADTAEQDLAKGA